MVSVLEYGEYILIGGGFIMYFQDSIMSRVAYNVLSNKQRKDNIVIYRE